MFGLSLILALAGAGQEPPALQGEDVPWKKASKGEIKAVARISKLLIDDVVTRKEIVAAIPYDAKGLGFSLSRRD